jgi:signal transduction histidine kinase
LGLSLVVGGGFALRVRQMKRRQAELTLQVGERTKDLLEMTQKLESTNAELREAIRQKDEVVSIVAHDFRSPLTVIQGLSGQLLQRVEDQEYRQMAEMVHERARYLSSLATNTLKMSSLEAGQFPMNFKKTSITHLIRSMVSLHDQQNSVEIQLVCPADEIEIYCDYDRIADVIDNLVHNAIKYSPQGELILVKLQAVQDGVEITVTDEGMGIASADLPLLFQKFCRLKSARQQGIKGTGLGLYISRIIIEAHGGRIWAESIEGKGSTFSFRLPLRPPVKAH